MFGEEVPNVRSRGTECSEQRYRIFGAEVTNVRSRGTECSEQRYRIFGAGVPNVRSRSNECSEQKYRMFGAEVPNVRTDISTVFCPEDGQSVVPRNLPTAPPNTPHSTFHHAHSREALLLRLLSTDQPKGQSSQISIAPNLPCTAS